MASEPFRRHESGIATTGSTASLFLFLSSPLMRSANLETPFVLEGPLERARPCGRHAAATDVSFAFIACVLSGSKRLHEKEKNESYPVSNPTQQQETLSFGFLACGHPYASVANLFRDFHIDSTHIRSSHWSALRGVPPRPLRIAPRGAIQIQRYC